MVQCDETDRYRECACEGGREMCVRRRHGSVFGLRGHGGRQEGETAQRGYRPRAVRARAQGDERGEGPAAR